MPTYSKANDNRENSDDSSRAFIIRQDARETQLKKYFSRFVSALSNAFYAVRAFLFLLVNKSPKNKVATSRPEPVEQTENTQPNYNWHSNVNGTDTHAELIVQPIELETLLKKAGLNTEGNRARIENHPHSEILTTVLRDLIEKKVPLIQSDLENLVKHPNLYELSQVLKEQGFDIIRSYKQISLELCTTGSYAYKDASRLYESLCKRLMDPSYTKGLLKLSEILEKNNILIKEPSILMVPPILKVIKVIFKFKQTTSVSILAAIFEKLPEDLIEYYLQKGQDLRTSYIKEDHLKNLNALLTPFQDDSLKATLSKTNLDILVENSRSELAVSGYSRISPALKTLNSAQLLIPENFKQLLKLNQKMKLVNIGPLFKTLNSAQLLTQENFTQLLNLNQNVKLTNQDSPLLKRRDPYEKLTDEKFEQLCYLAQDAKLAILDTLFKTLNSAQLLTQENVTQLLSLSKHEQLESLDCIFQALNSAQLLTQENVTQLLDPDQHEQLLSLNLIFQVFNSAQLLTQENVTQLLALDPKNILFTSDRVYTALIATPGHLYQQTVFNELIELSQQPNPENLLLEYLHDLRLPHAQNTHTASIHQSVSESAHRLAARYPDKIKDKKALGETIQQIKEYLSSSLAVTESTTQKVAVAQRAVDRMISDNEVSSYKDPSSKISLKQLLALSFIALNDDAHRSGTRADALGQFLEGLYEIQRGGNLSESGSDEKPFESDKPICNPGAFNKLLEKLQSIHPDVHISFVTKSAAAAKLPKLVNELFNEHLSHLARNAKTAEDVRSFTHLVAELKKEGVVEFIFNDVIKDKLAESIWDEFKAVYPDKSAPDFVALIESGISAELKLNDFQKELTESTAYRDFCSQMLYSPCLFSTTKVQMPSTEQEANPNGSTDNKPKPK